MGEDTGRDAGSPDRDTQRVTIADAARILGVKEPAIRKRIQRGTLDHDKGEDGRTYVYLDAGIPECMDTGSPASYPGQDERIGELKDQIDYLRDQLAQEREARRRADTIIAQLTQDNATLAARIPELEAPTEPRESPESTGEPPDPAEPQSTTEGQQEPTSRPQERSWWRRMFGT